MSPSNGNFNNWHFGVNIIDNMLKEKIKPEDTEKFREFCERCPIYPGLYSERDGLENLKNWWESVTNNLKGIQSEKKVIKYIETRKAIRKWETRMINEF